jgi:hypothetical protein
VEESGSGLIELEGDDGDRWPPAKGISFVIIFALFMSYSVLYGSCGRLPEAGYAVFERRDAAVADAAEVVYMLTDGLYVAGELLLT